MNYSDIRRRVQEHFRTLLQSFKASVSVSGPAEGERLFALKVSKAMYEGDPEGFLDLPSRMAVRAS